MSQDEKYRAKVLADLTCSGTPESIDRPLLVQFCGNDPDILLTASKHVEGLCDAVDLNLGCPQGIARKGRYGSFLMPETDLLVRIVQNLHQHLNVPVTCKIRLFPKLEDTIRLAKALESAGCYMLCVHGRTKEEKKQLTKETHFEEVRAVKRALRIPVITNGGVGSRADVLTSLRVTETHGVMSAESMLENPTLFAQPIGGSGGGSGSGNGSGTAGVGSPSIPPPVDGPPGKSFVLSRAMSTSSSNTSIAALPIHIRQIEICKEYLNICRL